MQVTETLTEGLKREYKVVVSATDIDGKLELRLQELGQNVRLPGFRPGKVPLNILRQRFSTSVMGEVLEKAVQDSSSQAMSERGLRPALQPKIEITSFDPGKDLEYTMLIEILPEIEITDLAKLEVERLKVDVPDDEVDAALENLAGAQKRTQPLTKPRKAAKGDVLVIDFRGTVDGEALPGMAAQDHHLELGSNQFVGTFEDQLIGADKDEARSITVTFPEAYANDKLAGKEAVFEVTIKDILATVPVPVDDELAKSLGAENLEAMKGRVRKQIEQDYQRMTRGRMKRDLLDQLAEAHDFPVPAGMVETEFGVIWKQVEDDREKGNIDPEDEGKDDEALKSEYREIAVRRVRLGLLLSEVGKVNSITVTPEEVNQALMAEARNYPGKEREVFEFYQKTPEAMANLRAPIFEDKVIDYITELAKVTERPVTPEEVRQETAKDQAEAAGTGKKKKTTKTATPAKDKKTKAKAGGKDAGKTSKQRSKTASTAD